MESNENTRKVNGREVNPESDLITVELLDWSKLNPDINDYLHTRIPERKDDEFYFDDQYSGFIKVNSGLCLISTKEAVTRGIEIFDYMQGLTGFSMGIFSKDKDPNVINIIPDYHFKVIIATELQKISTGIKMKLPDFMDGRYKYNSRIISNELGLIKYLKENDYKPFDKLKK